MNYPVAEQRVINRIIYNRPKGRGIKPLSAFGGLKKGGISKWEKSNS